MDLPACTVALKAVFDAMPGVVAEPMTAVRGFRPLVLIYKIMGKTFAILSVRAEPFVILKCDPFRSAKASFDTRPIFHQSDAAIRGHVFCSFLALVLAKELTRLCDAKGLKPEWQPLLNDLDRLQQATIEKDGKAITTRTHVTGQVGPVFQALGIALPKNLDEAPHTT